jgi:dTDP-4-dehydrorhamnose 3,5-epimerase
MQVDTTAIPGVLIVTPKKFGDERGFFSETFKASALTPWGVRHRWLQDNHSMSAVRGVVRGLHFQAPPRAQAKLLRVVFGAILDVAVDIRKGSPTWGKHVAGELSADNWRRYTATYSMLPATQRWIARAEGGLRCGDRQAMPSAGSVHKLPPYASGAY